MFKVDLTCFPASEGLHTSYSECCVWVDHCLQFCLLLLNIHPRVPGVYIKHYETYTTVQKVWGSEKEIKIKLMCLFRKDALNW